MKTNNFQPIINNLSKKYEIETGRMPQNIEQDIQKLIEKCPNIAYCPDFLDFERQFGGFLMYLDKGDFSLYSINSPDIFPMLTGEGDLIDEDGFMCMADYCENITEGKEMNSMAWAYKVDELPKNQKIYCKIKSKNWEIAYQNFTEMLENLGEDMF